ncbi:MAG: hypothetical protein ACYST6_17445, partial [Planctomycetota bacterium]
MATEKRNLSALDVNNGVTWSNASNAFTEDDNYASTGNNEFAAVGEYCGGNFQDITQTPGGASTDLTDFKVRFMDINSDHSDDTYLLQVYNPDTTAWETLETFDDLNLLPAGSLATKDYTTSGESSSMQSKYDAAADKTAFLNGLQIRVYQSAKSGGADKPEIGLAWANFTYNYVAAPLEVDVYDSPSLTDEPSIEIPVLEAAVYDDVGVSDAPDIMIPVLDALVFGLVGLTDYASAAIAPCEINVYDSVGATDSVSTTRDRFFFIEQFEGAGYEDGDWTETSGTPDEDYSTGSVSGAPATWDSQCLQVTETEKTENPHPIEHLTEQYFQFAFILESISISDGNRRNIFHIECDEPSSGTIFECFIENDGGIYNLVCDCFRNSPDSGLEVPSKNPDNTLMNLALDTEYVVEIKWDYTNLVWAWRVNGAPQPNNIVSIPPILVEGTLASGAGSNVTNIAVGAFDGSGTVTAYFDNIYITPNWSLAGNVVGDSIGVTDEVAVEVTAPSVLSVNVYDDITLTDEATSELTIYVAAVFDNLTIQDEVDALFDLYLALAYDSPAVADEVFAALDLFLALPADSIGLTDEAILLLNILLAEAYDDLGVTDSCTAQIPGVGVLSVSVFDLVHIHPAYRRPNVYDSPAVTDETSVQITGLVLSVSVYDDIGLTEDVSGLIPFLYASVADNIVVTDEATIALTLYEIAASDDLQISDYVSLNIPLLFISAFDAITMTDEPAVSIPVL